MLAEEAFNEHTNPEKFVTTETVLSTFNPWNKSTALKQQVTLLNNFNKKTLDIFEVESRISESVLYVDEKCFVTNNKDYAKQNENKEYFKNRRLVSKSLSMSKIHLLVSPIKKIYNSVTLTPEDVELLKHMDMVGRAVGVLYANKFKTIFINKTRVEGMNKTTFNLHRQIFAKYIQNEIPNKITIQTNFTGNKHKLQRMYNSKRIQRLGPVNTMEELFSNKTGQVKYKYNGSQLTKNNKNKLHLYGSKLDRIIEALNNIKIKKKEKNNRQRKHIEQHVKRVGDAISVHVPRGQNHGNGHTTTAGLKPSKSGITPNSRQPRTSTKSMPGITPNPRPPGKSTKSMFG